MVATKDAIPTIGPIPGITNKNIGVAKAHNPHPNPLRP